MAKKGKTRRKRGRRISLWELYQREDGICCKCGRRLKLIEATREHKKPRSQGGKDGKNYSNLGISCHSCNTGIDNIFIFR